MVALRVNEIGGDVGPVYRIPAYSRVRPLHISKMAGMVEIDWQRQRYAVFDEDLRERAELDGPGYPQKLRSA
jgi:hypothetical protein